MSRALISDTPIEPYRLWRAGSRVLVLLGVLSHCQVSSHAASYVYDSNSGIPSGWTLIDRSGDGASIQLRSHATVANVLRYSGDIQLNFLDSAASRPNNQTSAVGHSVIKNNKPSLISKTLWLFKTTDAFQFAFKLQTSRGNRTLIYTDSSQTVPVVSGNDITYGLGKISKSGKWIKVVRDLSKDLARVDTDAEMLGVATVSIVGIGELRKIAIEGVSVPGLDHKPKPPEQFASHESGSTQAGAGKPPVNAAALPALNRNPWSLNPYVVSARNTHNRDGELVNESGYAGLSANVSRDQKYFARLDINPDFSLIEHQFDDSTLDSEDEEKPDLRPFFKSGRDHFAEESEYFYSLRVPDFDYGVKAYMDYGATRAGALAVVSPDGREDVHLRMAYGTSKDNQVALDAVASDQIGLKHRLVGGTARNKFNNKVFYEIKGAATQDTIENEELAGQTGSLKVGWSPGPVTLSYTSDYYDELYNPVNGLVKEELPGTRGGIANAAYYHTGNGAIREINASLELTQRDALDGNSQRRGLYASTNVELLKRARLKLDYNDYRYRQQDTLLGEAPEESSRDSYWSGDADFNIHSSLFGYGFSVADGELGGGDYRYGSAYLWASPKPNLTFTLFNERLISFGDYRQESVKAKWDIDHRQHLQAKYSSGDNYQLWQLGYNILFSRQFEVYLAYQKLSESNDEIIGKLSWTLQ